MNTSVTTITKINGGDYLSVPVYREDGVFDLAAFLARAKEIGEQVLAEESTGVEEMLVNISKALIGLPQKKNMTEAELDQLLWNRKVRAGEVPDDFEKEKALRASHTRTLATVLRSRPGQFHVGQGAGVLIRYVDGDDLKDADGNPMFDAKGNPVPRPRHSDAEWTDIVARGRVAAEKKAAKAAQKAAQKG